MLAACMVALPAGAQVRPMSAEVPSSARPSMPSAAAALRGWYGELQRISAHMQQVHGRALRNPTLLRERAELMDAIRRAMDTADPALQSLASRGRRISGDAEQARARGDGARLRELEREAALIQARIMNVEQYVRRQPAIARQVQAYENLLHGEMIRIEPLTESLLARASELQRLLQSTLSQQQRRD